MVMASAGATASTGGNTSLRLTQLRHRLERLQRGDPCTPDDVTSAQHWADARAQSLQEAVERLAARRASQGARPTHEVGPGREGPAVSESVSFPRGTPPTSSSRELELLRDGVASLLAWPNWLGPGQEGQRRRWCEAVVAMTSSPRWGGWADAVCRTAVSVLPRVRSAAICVVAGPGGEVAAATDTWAQVLQELELIVGEGPATSARKDAVTVIVDDLEGEGSLWPGFASATFGRDVHAVTAVPLRVHGKCVGCLTFYGQLGADSELVGLEEANSFAEIAAACLRADLGGPSDTTDVERFSFYVATGVLAARLEITTDEADGRLRAHAFGAGLSLSEVADMVMGGHDLN